MSSAVRNSWLAMAVLMLCFAASDFAHGATTVTLQINSPPSNNVLDGIYVGSYSATNTQTHTGTQITCDDFSDESNYNASTYVVNTFSTLGNALWGKTQNATMNYEEVGWLTLRMLNQTGLTQGYYSYAIWSVFDPNGVLSWLKKYNDVNACLAVFGNSCTSSTASSGSLLYSAQQNYASGNYSNFLILTPQGCGSAGLCAEQEFFELVPEGGSALVYLLLAAVSCFGAILLSRRHANGSPA